MSDPSTNHYDALMAHTALQGAFKRELANNQQRARAKKLKACGDDFDARHGFTLEPKLSLWAQVRAA